MANHQIDQDEKCIVPGGVLVIVGGHEDKGGQREKNKYEASHSKEVLATFFQLTGRKCNL